MAGNTRKTIKDIAKHSVLITYINWYLNVKVNETFSTINNADNFQLRHIATETLDDNQPSLPEKLDDPDDKSKSKETEVVAEHDASVEVDEFKDEKEEIDEHDGSEKDDADEGGNEEEKEAKKRKITNQPLDGTVRRGKKTNRNIMLEKLLLNDEKQCPEHKLLADLVRNDVGKISKPCYIQVEKVMNIDRYSHVMHISYIATVELLDGLTSCYLKLEEKSKEQKVAIKKTRKNLVITAKPGSFSFGVMAGFSCIGFCCYALGIVVCFSSVLVLRLSIGF
ncbi:unnamed protein product [Trifolium pratense]|uniref:Uncharacterized protein n=1 Tax=Trifolium pratense TaxID=57577 RepID=A0ACB0L2F2_TRIPR|nr:unnamed protein product [Trifolium pratense]